MIPSAEAMAAEGDRTMLSLTDLEQAVLGVLLEGEDAILTALRSQLALAQVRERRFTGVGFFTYFALPPDIERVPVPEKFAPLGHVIADLEGTRHGAGFVLFLKKGRLHMLEGYTYDEPWPAQVGRFAVHRAQAAGTGTLTTDLTTGKK